MFAGKQKHTLLIAIATVIALLLCVVAYIVGLNQGAKRMGGTYSLRKVSNALHLIDKHYVDKVDMDSLIGEIVPQLMADLDPHSNYLTPQQLEDEQQSMQGTFFGIGVTFNTLIDTLVVVAVTPRGPSDLVGIKAGDRILRADGTPLLGSTMSSDSIMMYLRGPDKSKVVLDIYRPSTQESFPIEVIRGEVSARQTSAVYMVNDSLGCIAIPQFTMGVYEDFMKGYAELLAQGLKGLVIDLRGNPGGLLHVALALTNEFLPRGQMIIYTEGEHSPKNPFESDGTGAIQHIPLYVLIDGVSASSSEIVSGALQDNDRAIIIGRRSFGKGLVQKPYVFYDGSAIHLTIARYYTPSGRCIQRPYQLGEGEYYYMQDWESRAASGELFHADSIHNLSPQVYYTKGGRKVYGGGGIIPDVFIPVDTLGYTTYLNEVLHKGLLSKYAFVYSDTHRQLLQELGSPEACYSFLKNQGLVWQFAQWAHSRGVRNKNYLVYVSHDKMFGILSQIIIQQIYGDDAAAKVESLTDLMVIKAAELFANGVISPLQLPANEVTPPEEKRA